MPLGLAAFLLVVEIYRPFLPLGLLAFGLVALALIRAGSPRLAAVVLLVLAVFLVISAAVSIVRVRRLSARFESTSAIGRLGVARTPLAPSGIVSVRGQRWEARTDGVSIAAGDAVRVVGLDGHRLVVSARTRPAQSDPAATGDVRPGGTSAG